jgi:hypothetical protein
VVSERAFMTLFGTVRINRALYRRERNGPTRCPSDEWMKPVEGFWTDEAAKLAVYALTEFTSRGAEKLFDRIGWMKPSSSALGRLPRALSNTWERHRDELHAAMRHAYEIPDEAVTVAISLDGVMVNTRSTQRATTKAAARAAGRPAKGPSGYKEASVGVLSFYDANCDRLLTRRIGRMPEPGKSMTKQFLTEELARVRSLRPDLRVVAIADGAANNWSFLTSLHPDIEVVDFFHTLEHVKRRVDGVVAPSSTKNQSLFRRLRRTIRDRRNGARQAFTRLRRLETGRRRAPARLVSRGSQPDYYARHKHRMDYATLRNTQIPIGTGVTEGTCRHLVIDRLRRSGMRWAVAGGQAILTFRAQRINGQFDTAWSELMGHYRLAMAA